MTKDKTYVHYLRRCSLGSLFKILTCGYLEHSHPEFLSYSILPSQKAILLIIQYHFTIHPIFKTFILSYNTLK